MDDGQHGDRGLGAGQRARSFILAHTGAASAPLCPEITLHVVDALSDLWLTGERELAELGLDVPFWAAAWPGGQALARFVLDLPGVVRGARVLDLGTGSGIVAIAAAKAGARSVLAVDADPVATEAVALNAELNGVRIQARSADVLDQSPPRCDVILAADLWYEAPLAARVTPWLRAAAEAGARVLVADPGRRYLPTRGLVEVARYDVPTSPDLERERITPTLVFRVRPT